MVMPSGTQMALDYLQGRKISEPVRIATRKNGKYTEVKDYEFDRTERNQESLKWSTEADQFDRGQLSTLQQF
jgi:hypothetical protein